MSTFSTFIKRRPVVTAALGGAALLAGVSVAAAQYGWGGGHGHHRGPGFNRMERMCTMETGRWAPVMRAWIKADLNLTAQQAAEFDKLADVAQPAAEQIRAEVCGNFGPTAPRLAAPERLEKAAATMRKAAEAMEKAVAPAKAFYATLNEQQKTRVELLMERRRGGGMGYGYGGGWRGQMGPGGPMGGPMGHGGPMGGHMMPGGPMGPQGMPPAPPAPPRQ